MKSFVWLLDVDFVLNSNKAGWSRAPRSGWAQANNGLWKMRWEPEVMRRITKLSQASNLQVLWATSWCGNTAQLERLFGLPAFDSASSTGMSIAMKTEAALDVASQEHYLIWTDDEAVPTSGELFDTLTYENRSLLIRPKSSGKHQGLRPEHFDMVENFVLG